MATTRPLVVPETDEQHERRRWVGLDERGRELEVVAVVLDSELLVIHVMPTHYRGRQT